MSWIGVAVLGGLGAYTNYTNAVQQRKQKKEEMMANAAQIQYSPWTHAAVQVQGYGNTPNAASAGINGGLQGGLTGAMMASQFNKAQTPTPNAPQGKPAQTDPQSVQQQLMPQGTTTNAGGPMDNSGYLDLRKPNMWQAGGTGSPWIQS